MLTASMGAWALWMVRLALCLVWGWYLMSRNVRQAFRTPAAPSRAQAA